MNPWGLGAAALTVGWFLFAKQNRNLVAGKAYTATFRMPDSMPELPSEVTSILPPGAGVVAPPGSREVEVTFVAPRSAVMTDLQTPLGTLKLVSLKEMG